MLSIFKNLGAGGRFLKQKNKKYLYEILCSAPLCGKDNHETTGGRRRSGEVTTRGCARAAHSVLQRVRMGFFTPGACNRTHARRAMLRNVLVALVTKIPFSNQANFRVFWNTPLFGYQGNQNASYQTVSRWEERRGTSA